MSVKGLKYNERKGNKCIALENNRIGILLTQGQTGIVDAVDYNLIENYTWCVDYDKKLNGFYVVTTIYPGGEKKKIRMTRLILAITDSKILIDHRNHNTLDNTHANLRICNSSENNSNRTVGSNNLSTGIKNIYLRENGSFRVAIDKNDKRYQKDFKTLKSAKIWKYQLLNIEQVHGNFGYDGESFKEGK